MLLMQHEHTDLQSDEPFDKQAGKPDWFGNDASPDSAGEDSRERRSGRAGEQPVIEIVNTVTTRRRPGDRLITRPYGRTLPTHIRHPQPVIYEDARYEEQHYNGVTRRSSHMVIHSTHIINALKAVVAYYPDFHLHAPRVIVDAPYHVLYHHREELAAYKDNQPSTHEEDYKLTASHHIDVLLKYLDATYGREFREEEARHKLPNPVTTHEWYWTLFKPGQVVYAQRDGAWGAYIVSGFVAPRAPGDRYLIYAWYLRADGDTIIRDTTKFSVRFWEGEVPINSLSVFPKEFWTEELQGQVGKSEKSEKPEKPLREKLIEQGKQLWELLKAPTSKQYNGELVDDVFDVKDVQKGFVSGRVICDSSGFDEYCPPNKNFSNRHDERTYEVRHRNVRTRDDDDDAFDLLPHSPPRCGCRACLARPQESTEEVVFQDFYTHIPELDEAPDNDLFYMVCSQLIPGFILSSRRWGIFKISNLSDIKPDKEAFKYLVLDDKLKRTVKALIGRFAASIDNKVAPWGNDFVKSKGEGRIFLLHGQPGVGKTSTAECIAELANRPLIPLTSGDLLTSLEDVEKNLTYFLTLGQRYGALVLLDEADIYLEHRTASDITRNGLVSIFLRALEYYRGVLFLTTNRVQSFDTAFLSRIHVALHYKNLTNENRERIWAHAFERLVRDSNGKIHVSSAAKDYVFHHEDVQVLKLNGREIRNAMQTALALAESEAEEEGDQIITIRASHLEAVVEMSSSFKGYVAGLKGRDGCEGDKE